MPKPISGAFPGMAAPSRWRAPASRLAALPDVAPDPGNLGGWLYVPADRPPHPALVVVLHGCTQTAQAYDHGSGWSTLADRHGFVLLYPEQRWANNANLCFNWFVPDDTRRSGGEAASIRAMIAAVVRSNDIDPARIFVTGLSAGGAMTSVMLATYPETFAGGAIVAGLPYGCASNMPEALGAMRSRTTRRSAALGALVRGASAHDGPWPTISVWHGGRDATVDPGNADAIVEQWQAVHGVADTPAVTETVDGHPRRVWRDAAGRAVIEDHRIAALGHGTPLDTRGEAGCGVAGPFMLEAGISSTLRIARFWGLTSDRASQRGTPPPEPAAPSSERLPVERVVRATRIPAADPDRPPPRRPDIASVITDALRAAGLMR